MIFVPTASGYNRQRGFSLLELLIAFAIMAIALGTLYRATGNSIRNVGDLELRQRATSLAQSTIDRVDGVPPSGLAGSGRVGDMDWAIQSQPFDGGSTNPNAPRLHQVLVTIQWFERGEPKQLAFTTLRPELGLRRPGR